MKITSYLNNIPVTHEINVDAEIGAPPSNASFTYTPLGGAAPTMISFTDTSPGTPLTWAWDFDYINNPGIYTSTAQNPTHTYTVAGTYDVSLDVGPGYSTGYGGPIVITAPAATGSRVIARSATMRNVRI